VVAPRVVSSFSRLRFRGCGGVQASVICRECAAGMVFRAKASTVGGNGGGSPRGVAFPVEGTIEGYHILVARGSYGENPVLCGCATTAPFGVMPFLEASHLGTRLGLWQWWLSVGGVARCVAAMVVVHLVRVGRVVQRAHGGVASGSHIWCSGDLGVGWAEVLLSK
jgi:hypothetical protein